MQGTNFEDTSWRKEAECLGSPELFFPPITESHRSQKIRETKALALCGECDVRDECLSEALEKGEQGIWGGTLENDRRRIRRRNRITSTYNRQTFVNIGNTALQITEI